MKRIIVIIIATVGVITTLINTLAGITEENYSKAFFWFFCFIINATVLVLEKETLNN